MNNTIEQGKEVTINRVDWIYNFFNAKLQQMTRKDLMKLNQYLGGLGYAVQDRYKINVYELRHATSCQMTDLVNHIKNELEIPIISLRTVNAYYFELQPLVEYLRRLEKIYS